MEVKERNISEIKPYPNNPRRNDGAVDAVAASIKEFGFKNPVIIDKNGEIVCGHTRLEAAKRLGFKTVPCIMAGDLTEEQIKAFRLADNKTAELAEWDFELLNIEIEDIEMDLKKFGFEVQAETKENQKEDDDEEEQTVRCPRCGAKVEEKYYEN